MFIIEIEGSEEGIVYDVQRSFQTSVSANDMSTRPKKTATTNRVAFAEKQMKKLT